LVRLSRLGVKYSLTCRGTAARQDVEIQCYSGMTGTELICSYERRRRSKRKINKALKIMSTPKIKVRTSQRKVDFKIGNS